MGEMLERDLIIRGGEVIDGSGGPRALADVRVRAGRIAEVGAALDPDGEREIDATGKLVTPGFVDIHTHYDGQAIWSNRIDPSSWHGVTTIMMGNCGVGFAPCKPKDRDVLVALMEGVGNAEAIAALRNHVATEIGPIAKPRQIMVVDELPKTRSGKIMRRLLRDVAENREVGDVTTLADSSVMDLISAGLQEGKSED